MKKYMFAAILIGLLGVSPASAQVAGTATAGVEMRVLQQLYAGWSVKREILGKEVVNDKGEKVGVIDDLLITPDDQLSYAIVGAGGFLGIDRHDVAIPATLFKMEQGKLILPNATQATIKAMPQFDWAKKTYPMQAIELQLSREADKFDSELKRLNDKLRTANQETKVAIQKEIDNVKKKAQSMQVQVKTRMDEAKSEADAQINTLQDQLKQASDRQKAELENRIVVAKADYETRKAKLLQAGSLLKDALAN